MNSIVENIVDVTVLLFLLGCIAAGLVWAAEKEKELGIHGMSADRILVREEIKNNQK